MKWLNSQYPYKCYLTGKPLDRNKMQADHRKPVSRGGNFTLANIGLTNSDMNAMKADMLEEEFKQLLSLVADWEDKGESLFKMLRKSRHTWSK